MALLSFLQAALTKTRVYRLNSSFRVKNHKQHVTVMCSAKFPGMEHFNQPTKLIALLNYTKEKLWKSVPGSVKSFPWKKAESVALHELLILGNETLKWSLLVCFAFSWLSDILYSISRNKELVIPFGLFVGTIMAKYIDEITQEFRPDQKVKIDYTLLPPPTPLRPLPHHCIYSHIPGLCVTLGLLLTGWHC